ncbi:hypothetical protein BSNK01_09930 [Bacillaceae bacterium]
METFSSVYNKDIRKDIRKKDIRQAKGAGTKKGAERKEKHHEKRKRKKGDPGGNDDERKIRLFLF